MEILKKLDSFNVTLENGNDQLIKKVFNEYYPQDTKENRANIFNTVKFVIEKNYIQIFKYFCDNSCLKLNPLFPHLICNICVQNRLEFLVYFVETLGMDVNFIYNYGVKHTNDEQVNNTLLKLFENGYVKILRYLVDHKLNIQESLFKQIKNILGVYGECQAPDYLQQNKHVNIDMLLLLKDITHVPEINENQLPICLSLDWGYGFNNPYTLTYTDETGTKTEYKTHAHHNEIFFKACENGHVEAVDYFFKNKNLDKTMRKDGLVCAGKAGHASVVKYLVENGVELQSTTSSITKNVIPHELWTTNPGTPDLSLTNIEYLSFDDAYPSRDWTQNLYNVTSNKSFTNDDLIEVFMKKQDFEMVKFLCENLKGVKNIQQNVSSAIKSNDIHSAKYFLENFEYNFIEIHSDDFVYACENGFLDMVKFLVEKGIPDVTCALALDSTKHMEVIKFLIETKKFIPSKILFKNICENKINKNENIMYLIEKGVYIGDEFDLLFDYVKNGDLQMTKFLFDEITKANPAIRFLLEAMMRTPATSSYSTSQCTIM